MSIEKLIEENTAALIHLTAALVAFDKNVERVEVFAETHAVKTPAVEAKKSTSVKPSSGTASALPASSVQPTTGAVTESAETPVAFDFAKLAETGTKLVQSGNREALVAILKEHKAAKLSALPESVWSTVYERILTAQGAEG